jgi:hypothetical protein
VSADPNLSSTDAPVNPLRSNRPASDSSPGTATMLQSPAQSSSRGRSTSVELWLHRITVLMFVFVCAAVGVLLVIAPWRAEWTDNRLLLVYPGLRGFVSNGFVRGLCSGLGLLDIWIGFWEAVHYHEEPQH